MSPPFILSLSISPTGIIAAGTADGRLYIGTGGEKSSEASGSRQGRQRRWKGLKVDGRIIEKVVEGPIVALYVYCHDLLEDINLICTELSLGHESC